MKNLSALELAKYILGKYPKKNITPMKLQKLAYYSKVWTLIAGKPLLSASFVKWEYGPVNTQIYHYYKKYGGNVIPSQTDQINNEMALNQDEMLSFILDNYIDLSAYELSTMTHSEEPWINTPKDVVISDDLIISYYSKLSFAKNFSKDSIKKGPFHLLKNENWHSFTLDMDENDASSFESFSSYEEFLKQSQNAEHDSQEFFKEVFS